MMWWTPGQNLYKRITENHPGKNMPHEPENNRHAANDPYAHS